MTDRLIAWISARAAWVILAAGGLAVAEVVARYAFASPTAWTSELVVASCAVAFFLGGAEATRREAHIRISLIRDRAGGFWRRAMDLLASLAGLVFVAGLGFGAWRQFLEGVWSFDGEAWQPETTGRAWDVPLPPAVRFFLVLGVALIALALLARLLIRRRS